MVDPTQKVVEQFVNCLFRGQPTMPVLYYLPLSPPCRTILLLGRMLEIEFDLKIVNVMEGEHLKPDFVQVTKKITLKFMFLQNIKCENMFFCILFPFY